MKVKESGMILYNIELNGCLNGVYANNYSEGFIFNEIAKIDPPPNDWPNGNTICGTYRCVWFEGRTTIVDVTLTIHDPTFEVGPYPFSWETGEGIVFEGNGYRMNDKQIVVNYWRTER